ncbi:hypothetical protein M408DRAFT_293396 [Serendipita vermifera MAFF 305830]|uniref:Uncharacterized protein n=1 Tax=Serendipita vermifera MAFF 305830 TaxID=933852 RepID=A0A0C2W6S7_SERVB|nr:hypothetical protein M408DRAFT_293396 [Serendipita vermifera MAFF 305830]
MYWNDNFNTITIVDKDGVVTVEAVEANFAPLVVVGPIPILHNQGIRLPQVLPYRLQRQCLRSRTRSRYQPTQGPSLPMQQVQ